MREEFQLMVMLVKHVVKLGYMHSEGNQFSQFLNGCTTLKNRHKCMKLGFQTLDPSFKCNLGACRGMVHIKDGTDKVGHALINLIFEEIVRFKHE